MKVLRIIAILFLFLGFYTVNSNVHFCSNNDYVPVGVENKELRIHDCPSGVLFPDPTHVEIIHDFRKSGFCANMDICKSSDIICGRKKAAIEAQFLMGNLTVTENMEIFENYGKRMNEKKCSFRTKRISPQKKQYPKKVLHRNRKKRTASYEDIPLATGAGRMENTGIKKELIDETLRLFYYMAGLNEMDVTPSTEIAKLLEPSFQVIQKRCDPAQLDPMFAPRILKAFHWLLLHSGSNKFEDITTDTAKRLRTALNECSNNPHPIKVYGSDCLETITSVSLKKFGIEAAKQYEYDVKYVFQWGRYDPIIDAVWLAIDTIHGLCEPYFRKENLQHLYYVAMMNLLRIDSMQSRWISPTPLLREKIYDQIFIAPMNKSLAILDACALGGSFDETYKRGVRPIKYVNNEYIQRKKRSVYSPSSKVDPGTFSKVVYCLQSEQDRKEKFQELKRQKC